MLVRPMFISELEAPGHCRPKISAVPANGKNSIAVDARFGSAVAINGHIAVIGVPEDDVISKSSGSARIINHTAGSWSNGATLTQDLGVNALGALNGEFAYSVSIDGHTALIGVLRDDDK